MVKSELILILLLLLFISCSHEHKVSTEMDTLEILATNNPHLQCEKKRMLLKVNKIKSATYIVYANNTVDSTTYIEYDREGKIRRKTTSECSTYGCVPFIMRYEYYYLNGRIDRMGDFRFDRKYDSVKDYWSINERDKLRFIDWEKYEYNVDTITIKSSIRKWKYIKDS